MQRTHTCFNYAVRLNREEVRETGRCSRRALHPHTDACEPQQMAEAGEVAQRVLIKDNAPRSSNCQGGLTLSKRSLFFFFPPIQRLCEKLLIFPTDESVQWQI